MTALLAVLGWCLAALLGALAVARFMTLSARRFNGLWAPAVTPTPTPTAAVPAPRAAMVQQQSEPAGR